MSNPKPSRRRRWAFVGLAALAALLLVEILLQGAAAAIPRFDWWIHPWRPSDVPDRRFGHRGDPAFPEHDAAGFRNASIPDRAAVVAIGDSQTSGVGVPREKSWPAQLGAQIGRPTYQIAWPGWGPREYAEAVPEALARRPDVIVAAFYFGNDLHDAFRSALRRDEPTDPAARDLETCRPFDTAIAAVAPPLPGAGRASGPSWVRNLAEWSATGATLRALALRVASGDSGGLSRDAAWSEWKTRAAASQGTLLAADAGGIRTVFTPRYRALALDSGDPRLRSGLDLSVLAFRRLDEGARKGGARFLVLLIPTKEAALAPGLPQAGWTPELQALVRGETEYRARLTRELEAAGIACVDALPAMVASEGPAWPQSADGHPTAAGHAAIARAVADHPILR